MLYDSKRRPWKLAIRLNLSLSATSSFMFSRPSTWLISFSLKSKYCTEASMDNPRKLCIQKRKTRQRIKILDLSACFLWVSYNLLCDPIVT